MRAELRAGAAVYNDGEYHGAHDAWEDYWLDLESGTADERLLHGLIQFTAALHHAEHANWRGLSGLVASAREYLDGLPDDYRAVNLGEIRAFLDAMHADPEVVERRPAPRMTHEGAVVALDDLDFAESAIAAAIFAEEAERYEEDVVEQAIAYAAADLDDEKPTSQFVTLVMDFARDGENRDLVYQRLTQHVNRRESKEHDVDGLFDDR